MLWYLSACPAARLARGGLCRSPWTVRASGEEDGDISDDHEESWREPPPRAATKTLLLPSKPVHDLAWMEPLRSSMPPVWIDPMLEEFAILLQVATSSVTVALRTADSSSPVQAVPPQTGPVVLVAEAPVAGPSLPMDGLMADQAISGLATRRPRWARLPPRLSHRCQRRRY